MRKKDVGATSSFALKKLFGILKNRNREFSLRVFSW